MPTNLLLIIILSVIGVINTSYLSYHAIKKTPVKCIFFPPEQCLKVQQSKFSRTLGFPKFLRRPWNVFRAFSFECIVFSRRALYLLANFGNYLDRFYFLALLPHYSGLCSPRFLHLVCSLVYRIHSAFYYYLPASLGSNEKASRINLEMALMVNYYFFGHHDNRGRVF